MTEKSEAAQILFDEIRKIDNRLRWLGDTLHPEMGLTAAKRSLLLSLHREGPQTVPDLARERLVSRQVIQTQANDLLKEGLICNRSNPNHRRSPLLALSPQGERCISRMLEKEKAMVENSPQSPTVEELVDLQKKLRNLRERLERFGEKTPPP